jgi:hypothetical protein
MPQAVFDWMILYNLKDLHLLSDRYVVESLRKVLTNFFISLQIPSVPYLEPLIIRSERGIPSEIPAAYRKDIET